jgi:hypothetical protein
MELEGIALNEHGHLIPLYSGVEDFPMFLFAQLNDGETNCHFAASLPGVLQTTLSEQIPHLQFPNTQQIIGSFEEYNIKVELGHFKTYQFPEQYQDLIENEARAFSGDDLRVQAFGFDGSSNTVYAVERDDEILSACVSSRQNNYSAESWVMTAPNQRGKGLGAIVVSRWASEMLRAGIVPFYSHAIDNIPSARLAKQLGLVPMFEEIVLEEK